VSTKFLRIVFLVKLKDREIGSPTAIASRQFPRRTPREDSVSKFGDLIHRWNSGKVDRLCYDAHRTTQLTIFWEKGNVDHAT
jgi:hypothetical protein